MCEIMRENSCLRVSVIHILCIGNTYRMLIKYCKYSDVMHQLHDVKSTQ